MLRAARNSRALTRVKVINICYFVNIWPWHTGMAFLRKEVAVCFRSLVWRAVPCPALLTTRLTNALITVCSNLVHNDWQHVIMSLGPAVKLLWVALLWHKWVVVCWRRLCIVHQLHAENRLVVHHTAVSTLDFNVITWTLWTKQFTCSRTRYFLVTCSRLSLLSVSFWVHNNTVSSYSSVYNIIAEYITLSCVQINWSDLTWLI